MQIAPDLASFGRLLAALAEVTADISQFECLIIAETGPPNVYWREALDERQSAAVSKQPPYDIDDYNPADFEGGDLIVNDLGPHKLKVMQIISKSRGLSLKATLALAETPQFKAASGVRLQLRRLSEQLKASGATVEFGLSELILPPA